MAHSAEYDRYMASDAWRLKRQQTFARHPVPRCHCCNRRHTPRRPCDVHHLTYERFGREMPGDLVLVCRICHSMIHEYAQSITSTLREATALVRLMRSGTARKPVPNGVKREHAPTARRRKEGRGLRQSRGRDALDDHRSLVE